MATTYLKLTNEVLRELNEVQLTSSSFSGATGIQAFVQEAINRSLNDIANQEPQLPFFASAASGGTDPFYGNVTVYTPNSGHFTLKYFDVKLQFLKYNQGWIDQIILMTSILSCLITIY